MRIEEACSPKTLVESSLRLVHQAADLLEAAAEFPKSDFHVMRLQGLAAGFRSLDGPLTKIASALENGD
jgi:hypothetical protein